MQFHGKRLDLLSILSNFRGNLVNGPEIYICDVGRCIFKRFDSPEHRDELIEQFFNDTASVSIYSSLLSVKVDILIFVPTFFILYIS